jgi:hypothetical protein
MERTAKNEDAVVTWKAQQLTDLGHTPQEIAAAFVTDNQDDGYLDRFENVVAGDESTSVFKNTDYKDLAKETQIPIAELRTYSEDTLTTLSSVTKIAEMEEAIDYVLNGDRAHGISPYKERITYGRRGDQKAFSIENPTAEEIKSYLTLKYPNLSANQVTAVLGGSGAVWNDTLQRFVWKNKK